MNPTDYLVLSALNHFANGQGTVAVSVRNLGAHIGRSQGAVASSLKRLVAHRQINELPRTSSRGVGRFQIAAGTSTNNRGRSHTDIESILPGSDGLPDMFRTPALRTAGPFHRAAPKGQKLTVSELLGLGVVRTSKTLRKILGQLADLPAPLAMEHPDPAHTQRKLWIIHPLTVDAEAINLDYLNKIPGAEPKTRAMHERENAEHQRGYLEWFIGHRDVDIAYARDVAPFIEPDPNNLGCEVWTRELNGAGYGVVNLRRPGLAVHRLSWLNQVGYLAPDHVLHHMCGNRRCTYVGHLAPMSPEQHRAIHSQQV